MRIAIVGAPGSGKAELMEFLQRTEELSDHTFIDLGTEEIAIQGRGLGPKASYHEHILLHATQQRQLDLAENPLRVVMSGTVLQRLAHLCVALQEVSSSSYEPRAIAERTVRLQPSIEVFTSLAIDAFRADVVFFLQRPATGDLINLNYEDSVQHQLRDVMDTLQIPYREMIGNVEERAQYVLEAANEFATADT